MPRVGGDQISRKSLGSTSHKRGAHRRSRSATSGRESISRSQRKTKTRRATNAPQSGAKYTQLKDEDEGLEMTELDLMKPV